MNNKRATKRSLLTSVMALVMCVVMLVGTTFAWFTDTASTAVNKIQAGNLDVALEMKDSNGDWVSAEGKTLEFKKASAANGTEVLWEPGCTYTLPELRIRNNGNLALKYKVLITGIKGDAKLNNAIEWTITDGAAETDIVTNGADVTSAEYKLLKANDAHTLTIKGHMKDESGNEYQNLSIDGIGITVVAAQYTYEHDSKDDQYDKESTYLNTDKDGNILIGSAGDLRYFASTLKANGSAYSGKTIKLTSDIDLGGALWTPMTAKGLTFDGQEHTISNFKADGTYGVGLFGSAQSCTIRNLKVDKAAVTGINQAGAIVGKGVCANIDKCEVTKSTITNKNVDDNGDKVGAVIGYLSGEQSASVTNCKVSGCTLKGYRDVGGLIGMANGVGAWTVTGNTVKDTTVINDRSIQSREIAEDGYNIGKVIGRRAGSSNTEDNNTAGDDVVITVFGSDKVIKKTAANANIVIEETAVVDSTTEIGKGTTISGGGTDKTTVEVEKAKIAADDVTIKDMTINGSGASGTAGALGINGDNTTIENVVFNGEGTGEPENRKTAVTVSTGASSSGTTFKGVKITNTFRGIQFWNLSGNSVIEDCVLDVSGYTFNIDAVEAGSTLTVKNTTLNGWTSYTGGDYSVSFEGCKFGLNTYANLRPYCETEMKNCEFSSGYQLRAQGSGTYTITLTNCTKNNTEITANNVRELLLDTEDWNKNVTLIVNGTAVSLN